MYRLQRNHFFQNCSKGSTWKSPPNFVGLHAFSWPTPHIYPWVHIPPGIKESTREMLPSCPLWYYESCYPFDVVVGKHFTVQPPSVSIYNSGNFWVQMDTVLEDREYFCRVLLHPKSFCLAGKMKPNKFAVVRGRVRGRLAGRWE